MFFYGNNGCNSTEFNVYTQMINVIPMALQNARFRTIDSFLLSSLRKISFKDLHAALLTWIRASSSGAGITIFFNQGFVSKPLILTESCILM
jgi:hypothetical protein